MKQLKMAAAVCAIVVAGVLPLTQAVAVGPDTIRKVIHAKLSVNADGHVTQATIVEAKVPAAIGSAVLDRAKSWRFEPVISDGKVVPSITFAGFYACAIRSADGYDLVVHPLDNGPLLVRGSNLELQPVVTEYSKDEQSFKVVLKVLPDGTAQLQDVVMEDVDPRVREDLRISVKHWLAGMRYQPEMIGGQPVPTVMEWEMGTYRPSYTRHSSDKSGSDPDGDSTCDAARAAHDLPHSLENPVKRRVEDTAPAQKPPRP